VFTGTTAFTENQRRDAVEGMLRAIRAKLPDKLIIIDGYAWRDGGAFAAKPNEAQELGAIGDGVLIGEFLRAPISDTKAFKSETNWKRDVDYLAAISQDDRIVLLSTKIAASGVNTDTLKQWLDYSAASYLIGKNGKHTYFQFDASDQPQLTTSTSLYAPIGAPTEPYAKLDTGVYKRLFANGIVLVNPTNESKKVKLDREYRTLSGSPVTDVTMTSNTGLILLKP
jgi:hypothetical protein